MNEKREEVWGSEAVDEEQGLDIIKKSYGCDGTIYALVAGDMGYEPTHITIPRSHIIALVEDWPEFSKKMIRNTFLSNVEHLCIKM